MPSLRYNFDNSVLELRALQSYSFSSPNPHILAAAAVNNEGDM